MAHRRRRSLRLELIASLAVVLSLAVLSLSLVGELLGGRRHVDNERARVHELAQGLALVVSPLLPTEPGIAPHRADLERMLRPSVGTAGVLGLELHRREGGRDDLVLQLGLPSGLPPPAATDEAVIDELGDGSIVVDKPVRLFGRISEAPRFVLRVVAQPSPWAFSAQWPRTLLLASGVGSLLLVLGSLLVELQVVRPLQQVRAAADEVARGNLEVKVPDDGPHELQSLADTFNHMTTALRGKLEELAVQRAQALHAERLASVGRITAGVAHEVGNPLAAILGYVELLLDPRMAPPLSDERRGMLERMREQIQRIQSLVGQLLAYSRAPHHEPRPVEIAPLVRNLLALLRHDPRCAGVELRTSESVPARALAEPARLEQVLQNLVVNACQAARQAAVACIEVRWSHDARGVWIEVQDDGPGVAPEHRSRLFEPFFTTARPGEGTGLGLAISQELVAAMGGRLRCLDDGARPPLLAGASPGAVFRVELPSAEGFAPRSHDGVAVLPSPTES